MSEFTKRAEAFLYDTDDPYRWGREVQDLLRTLDARVRALEARKWTNVDPDVVIQPEPRVKSPSPSLAAIQQKVLEAVLAERERCAKVAEGYKFFQGHYAAELAKEIRRGA